MRMIKFRAWIQDDESEDPKFFMTHDIAFEQFEPINDLLASVEHLMQFTGLFDKNGKEIYEGDILRNHWFDVNGKFIGHDWVVKFMEYSDAGLEYGSSGHFGFCASRINPEQEESDRALNDLPNDKGIEVIGNVYENPDLMPPQQLAGAKSQDGSEAGKPSDVRH